MRLRLSPFALSRRRHHQPRLRAVQQVADLEPHDLARPGGGHRRELANGPIPGCRCKLRRSGRGRRHRQDDVAVMGRVRDQRQPFLPGAPADDPLVLPGRQLRAAFREKPVRLTDAADILSISLSREARNSARLAQRCTTTFLAATTWSRSYWKNTCASRPRQSSAPSQPPGHQSSSCALR